LLQNINRHELATLIRAILIYSALNGVLSIFYFWIIKDQIAVAALVGGERIVRLADLLSPLLIFLHLLYNKIYTDKKLSNIFLIPLIILVLLGMFRSVWAAFLISYFFANIIYPSIAGFRRMFFTSLFGIFFILIFEWVYEYLFHVDGVILGRIIAGIGTADSMGRISSAKDVLDQFFENPLYVTFGAGFGKLVWFVNDFGDGEVFALQPLGSLSNYFIVFLFQVGVLMSFAFLSYVIYSFFWIKKNYRKSDARLLTFIGIYFFVQWMTFPTSIHYPVALIIGVYFALATNIIYLNPTKVRGLKL
jgi:Na+/serine symporter